MTGKQQNTLNKYFHGEINQEENLLMRYDFEAV